MDSFEIYQDKLAPWEEKKPHPKTLKIDDLENIKDILVAQHREAMKNATIRTISFATANEGEDSAAMAAAINQLCNNLSVAIKSMNLGIASLQATFEWGISELAWWLELQSKQMREVVNILESPQQTKANERMTWANALFFKGLHSEAKKEYENSIKLYQYNPISYISLGIIHLFHLIDKKKALYCFKQAEKYAEGDSAYYTAYALMYQGLAYLDLGDIKSAEMVSAKGIDKYPDLGILHYHNAQYNALLKNELKSIASLSKAVTHSIGFVFKADTDPFFDNSREAVNSFISQKTQTLNTEIQKQSNYLNKYFEKMNEVLRGIKGVNLQVDNPTPRINERLNRNSMIDTLEAARILNETQSPQVVSKKKQAELLSLYSETKNHQRNLERTKKFNFKEKLKKTSERNGFVAMAITAVAIILILFFRFNILDKEIGTQILWGIGTFFIATILFSIVKAISHFIMNINWFFNTSKPNKEEQANQKRIEILEKILGSIKELSPPKLKEVEIPGATSRKNLEKEQTVKDITARSKLLELSNNSY